MGLVGNFFLVNFSFSLCPFYGTLSFLYMKYFPLLDWIPFSDLLSQNCCSLCCSLFFGFVSEILVDGALGNGGANRWLG